MQAESSRTRRGEGLRPRRLAPFLAARYLRGRRSRLLGGTARAALGSCALGVAAMVVAVSLMNGYTQTLVEKMMSAGALIVMPTFGPGSGPPRSGVEVLGSVPGVTEVRRAVQAQGSLQSEDLPGGTEVFLRGIDPGPGPLRAEASQLERRDGRHGVVLGKDLAERLGVQVGDPVDLVALDFGSLDRSSTFRFRGLTVTGVFETGFWLFDREYAILDLAVVHELTSAPVFFEVDVADPDHLATVEKEARARLGDGYLIRDWQRYNPDLFTALRLQKWGLFLLLGLIVVVSTFSVVSTLVVLVRERTREIGVLTALGARPALLRRVFVQCGLILGGVGTAIGLVVGVGLCWVLSRYRLLSFDSAMAEIYFIDQVPFLVRWSDLVAVTAFTLVSMALASRVPAARAARLRPADALRYE